MMENVKPLDERTLGSVIDDLVGIIASRVGGDPVTSYTASLLAAGPGKCAKKLRGDAARSVKEAHEQVEEQEDEHLYHSQGWCRELWIQSLGMKAVLPPPEERKHVKTAIGAARAQQASERNR